MMRSYKYLILLILLIFIIQPYLFAQSNMSARSIALSGAFSTSSRGANTIGWNPANLGYNDNPNFSWKFLIFPFVPTANIEISNNSISSHWLNNEFFTGKFLDNQDKARLLDYFPETGFEAAPIVNIDIASFSFGSWAFSLSAETISNVQLPKDLFQFMFYGNKFNHPIDLSSTNLESQTLATITVYHGWQLEIGALEKYIKQLNLGVGLKYLGAGTYINIEEMDASVNFTRDQAIVDGKALVTGAAGGHGLALDIGASAQVNERLYTSYSLHNLGGKINWGSYNLGVFDQKFANAEEDKKGDLIQGEFAIHSIIDKNDFGNADSLIEEGIEADTTYFIDKYSSSYPAYMNIGAEYRAGQNLKLLFNYQQFFRAQLAFSTAPRVSLGSEYIFLSAIPIRAGFSLGGKDHFRWGFGSGLNLKHYTFDFGFSQIGGMFNRAKGFRFTITSMLLL